ncbi:two-component sensor histidine kinase [Streptomyces bathyalis]|uniref:Sensor-like histidine kinase SenX3 n=1 Tax=Streptomyces bathyalis TaxID=2710756 RepID=A0A7T1T7Z9_9ACTN|nr:ATP-binding protein [Streptomyces bathyalis]QPP08100.1 two-component sensor histidine kinase [Streptomyces bathyalis]
MNVNAAVAAAAAIAGVLTGVIAMLAFRWSERDQARPTRSSLHTEAVLPPGVDTVLSVLRSSAVVLDEADEVVKASSAAYALGLVRGGRLAVEPMLKMARETRRDGEIRQVDLDLPRRGTGRGDALAVSARVAPLGSRLVLLLVEDMTEARRIEAVRRDFVANVSHELKTPVGALSLLSEAVLDAADDPEAVERFAGRMQYEATRLTSLVQELIDLSRVQNDDPLGDSEQVGVDELMGEAIDRCRQSAGSKQITLVAGRTSVGGTSTSGTADGGLHVWGNRSQLAAALGNLVENAVNYSPARTRVGIAGRRVAAPGGDFIEISVSDQGIGISERDKERVFERFYRVDPARSRATGGTGLGLAIVKHVAASHGGEVTVWSAEGQGSTFTLRLPEGGPGRSGAESQERRGGSPSEDVDEELEDFEEAADSLDEAGEADPADHAAQAGPGEPTGPAEPADPDQHRHRRGSSEPGDSASATRSGEPPPASRATPATPSSLSPSSPSPTSFSSPSPSPFTTPRGLLRAPETAPEVLP